jgi:hypothetical protein
MTSWKFPEIPDSVIREVAQRQNLLCAVCGNPTEKPDRRLHFVIPPHWMVSPESLAWSTTVENLALVCPVCFFRVGGGDTVITVWAPDSNGALNISIRAEAIGHRYYRLLEDGPEERFGRKGDIITITSDVYREGPQRGWRFYVHRGVVERA